MRVIFLGSPAHAVPVAAALRDGGIAVAAAVTQPDRPAGRGRPVTPPPVAAWAVDRGIPVLQPPSLRPPEVADSLAALAPDALVVAAYGRILPPPLLSVAPLGCLNVHPSLLPRHRGPSPVAEAILQGDAVTGVTIMLLDEGMDTGPVLAQERRAVTDADTTGTLTAELFAQGAGLLTRTLADWAAGRLTPTPQDAARATVSRKLGKEDGLLDFARPAVELQRQVRAMDPWPGAYTAFHGRSLKALRTAALPNVDAGAPPGTVVALSAAEAPIGVATGAGALALLELQLEGRRPADAAAFLRGRPDLLGARLGG